MPIIRYISDIHLEFIDPIKLDDFISQFPPPIPHEICILAGDIGKLVQKGNNNYDNFMRYISKTFVKTFVIAGNHEYYSNNNTIDETNRLIENYFEHFDNISFLNNKYEYYNGYCFVGTTLWSKIIDRNYTTNDVHYIPHFNVDDYNRLNSVCIDFLQDTIENNDNCVIITHHLPSYSLINEKYKRYSINPYNQCFYCDLDGFIDLYKNRIKCWVYGHTHMASKKVIGGVNFLCNPIGYPGENKDIDFGATYIF